MLRSFKSLALAAALGTCAFTLTARAEAPAAAHSATQKVTLRVEKMACTSCAEKVTSTLKGLDGVKDAKVDLKEKGAVVEYDPAKVTPQKLVDAVNGIGFKASLPKNG